jgi:hypothetical protein
MAISATNKSHVNGFMEKSRTELIIWCLGPSSNSAKE